jgi:hypothetical protein
MPKPYGRHGPPRYDRDYQFPLGRIPLPADAANAGRWHRIGGGYMREFESDTFQAFPGASVDTGGAQIVMDGAERPVTVRTVRVVTSRDLAGTQLVEHQAREFARALIDAANYIRRHTRTDRRGVDQHEAGRLPR